MPIDDDEPTKPRFGLVTCPACKGEGGYLVGFETSIGYSQRRARCFVCKGKKMIGRREALDWQKVLGE